MTIVLARPEIMKWGTKIVPDHGRSELSIEFEPIEKKQRMWDGTNRKYHINTKRTFSCSWEMLPTKRPEVVGQNVMDAKEIETFYNNRKGAFLLKLYAGDGSLEQYTVMISDYSRSVVKRGNTDYWNISVSMEEC